MPSLTFKCRETCPLCRCRIRGIRIGSFRVSKASLVSTSSSIVAADRTCPECGFPVGWPARWALDAESQQVVDVARAKRGWS